jgi:hypothetical protein
MDILIESLAVQIAGRRSCDPAWLAERRELIAKLTDWKEGANG